MATLDVDALDDDTIRKLAKRIGAEIIRSMRERSQEPRKEEHDDDHLTRTGDVR